jgi:hypothetical protein
MADAFVLFMAGYRARTSQLICQPVVWSDDIRTSAALLAEPREKQEGSDT